MAFLGGFVEEEAAQVANPEMTYSSATEHLAQYSCRPAETKRVIMGGIEDGFDPAGDETTELPEVIQNYIATTGSQAASGFDDERQNRNFAAGFDIPARTFHGIVTINLGERSGLNNDTVSFGYFKDQNYTNKGEIYSAFVAQIKSPGTWSQENDYSWADLARLNLWQIIPKNEGGDEVMGKSHETLIDAIRRNEGNTFVAHIADDTIVDFMGFALCLEPEDHKGSVMRTVHHTGPDATLDFGEGFASLYSISGYGGSVACEESLPVACIDDQNIPAPDPFTEMSSNLWSGGFIKFTKPVPGDRFNSEDEADNYCAAGFGGTYRMVNIKDGNWQGALVGYGEYPQGYDEFWVTYKDSPHHNCWDLRMGYEDVARLEAEK